MSFKYTTVPEHAAKIQEWFKNRGGVAVWQSIDLSDPGAQTFTPAKYECGTPYGKPHWKFANKPKEVVTDIADFGVRVPKEVKRFHIAIRRGTQGLIIKLTDASTARVQRECEKAGDNAWYEFNYDTQEAVIYMPDSETALSEWK